MIAYFDTSAVVPLLIEEPSTKVCNQIWTDASRLVSVRLLYPETRAVLARARRMGRVTRAQASDAATDLERMLLAIDHVEVTADLTATAGALADEHDLRGYDAVHLAAAAAVADDDLVLVTGDAVLAAAGTRLGLAVASTAT